MESFPSGPKKLSLDQLLSETPIQGLGYERFTEAQKKDLESLLSAAGSSLDDPLLKELKGDSLADIMEYAQAAPGSLERAALKDRISEAVAHIREEYYRE